MFVVNTDKGYLTKGYEFSDVRDEAIRFDNGLGKKERRAIYDMLIGNGVVDRYWFEDVKE